MRRGENWRVEKVSLERAGGSKRGMALEGNERKGGGGLGDFSPLR